MIFSSLYKLWNDVLVYMDRCLEKFHAIKVLSKSCHGTQKRTKKKKKIESTYLLRMVVVMILGGLCAPGFVPGRCSSPRRPANFPRFFSHRHKSDMTAEIDLSLFRDIFAT